MVSDEFYEDVSGHEYWLACLKFSIIWKDVSALFQEWVPKSHLYYFEQMIVDHVFHYAQLEHKQNVSS